ncbi:flagellar basal body P-ring formation chaperone FlgA [Ilumatobacter fluminis]|uniref:Flagellar basal body P-ring formation chaperone FlgA n=1 Tax=Ilumatobacter fluminis TaxID=467091 RepID=A0A4R7HUZ1_9ACTN|nr:SAF domain-containing protein [Ilumatobacter fluminis]TDT14690.1 flagellar basal body P-ring formation chaperone FlgA [Ilumatobacter fluminis]
MTNDSAHVDGEARGFRPGSRRRARIAAGVAIAAAAVLANVLIYTSLSDSTEVVQFVDNVRAGERIGSADVRLVEIDGDVAGADLVTADQLGSIVNQYARTFIPSGSLASIYVVQPDPLVTAGTAVVAVAPADGLVPTGITERSRVRLVLPDGGGIEGRVVSIARNDVGGADSLSVEVAEADAAIVAGGDDFLVALLDPQVDPATEANGS